MARYVQHKSGQGEAMAVYNESEFAWCVRMPAPCIQGVSFSVPKSEYIEVPAPEVWEDVTEICGVVNGSDGCASDGCTSIVLPDGRTIGHTHTNYRLRKVQLETPHKCGMEISSTKWAFIIERRTEGGQP